MYKCVGGREKPRLCIHTLGRGLRGRIPGRGTRGVRLRVRRREQLQPCFGYSAEARTDLSFKTEETAEAIYQADGPGI